MRQVLLHFRLRYFNKLIFLLLTRLLPLLLRSERFDYQLLVNCPLFTVKEVLASLLLDGCLHALHQVLLRGVVLCREERRGELGGPHRLDLVYVGLGEHDFVGAHLVDRVRRTFGRMVNLPNRCMLLANSQPSGPLLLQVRALAV